MTVYIVTLTSDREGERSWLQTNQPTREYQQVLKRVNWHLKKDARMTFRYDNGTFSYCSSGVTEPGWNDWFYLVISVSMAFGVVGAVLSATFLISGQVFLWLLITTAVLLGGPWLIRAGLKSRDKRDTLRQWNSLTSGLDAEPLPAISESTYWVMRLLDETRSDVSGGSPMNQWANRYGYHFSLLLAALNEDTTVAAAYDLHCMVQANATLPGYDEEAAEADEAMLAPHRQAALQRVATLDEWAAGLAKSELTSRRAGVEAVARALEM